MIDLQRFRKEHNIKQSEISEILGVKQPYVSAIERGVRPLNEEQFRLLYNRFGDILLPYKTTERPLFESEKDNNLEMPREVFDKISQLIDTVCAQQGTIADQQKLITDQHRTIDRLTTSVESGGVRSAEDAGCADVG